MPAKAVQNAAPAPSGALTGAMRLQFVCAANLASRLIAWYGNGYDGFSHVDAILPDGSLLGARADAVGGQSPGVRIRPPAYERWTRISRVTIPCSAADAFTWQAWLRSQVGEPYDSDAIWGFILGRSDHAKGHWICSAVQTGALEKVGKMPRLPVPPSQVTPNSLFLLSVAVGGTAAEVTP